MAERQRENRDQTGNEAAGAPASGRVLGLDIGGTASRARLCEGARIVAESRAPSASLPAAGLDGARTALAELLAALPLDPARPLDAVCAGSAGLSVPGAREFLERELTPLTRPGRVVIVSDASLVLPAAGVDAGVAVICGTGSIAVGSQGGRSVQTGGWGYLLGDEGSGYWIVREALRELLARRDRNCPPGDLSERLLAATGASDLGALHRRYLEQPHRPRHWAQYAEVVLASSDPAAADIRSRAASAVATLAVGALEQLAATPEEPAPADAVTPVSLPVAPRTQAGPANSGAFASLPVAPRTQAGPANSGAFASLPVAPRTQAGPANSGAFASLPVVLGGGLFGNEAFASAARDALRDRLPQSAVSVLTEEPVAGAVRLAARTAVSA